MTRHEWLTSNDLASLLPFIARRASERKLRLYLCAGCRHITHLFYNSWSVDALDVAEQYADGLATEANLGHARYSAEAAAFGYDLDMTWRRMGPTTRDIPKAVYNLVRMGALPEDVLYGGEAHVAEPLQTRLRTAAYLAEDACRAGPPRHPRCPPYFDDHFFNHIRWVDWPGTDLVRCIFGNPFRRVFPDRAWLNETVRRFASAIYADRAFDRLPILADALEDAGCTDAEALAHLRDPGLHARGCWVVDRILGKE